MVSDDRIHDELARAARDVIDPETGLNVMDMGLVFGIEYIPSTRTARVEMTFTTPSCPAGSVMVRGLEQRLKLVEGIDEVRVNVTFEKRWTPELITAAGRVALGWR